jgi:ankyrin repeat protein
MSRNPKHEPLKQARKGHLGRIDGLLSRDVDINCKGKFGQTPVFEAALAGQLDAVRFLLKRGADPGILSNDGASPSFFAWARGYVEIVDLLMEHGADVNASRRPELPHGPEFCSPLQVAISSRHDEIAKTLIAAFLGGTRISASLRQESGGGSRAGYPTEIDHISRFGGLRGCLLKSRSSNDSRYVSIPLGS